ncbi:signal peptidase I [Pseudosulfitobacter pseudonitzschiae]|uniref:Signal peptidase I n=1 Tax=Pseudosulfitobacter pseudonitzschiae TaxID=1402135 RepID=A0A073JBK9_9RHOB|nr:signal peptidase I [Pseudosulfitobacter pseudonitzschiae]KEJ95117.1 signal peptidase [Pseudosulfitobacter pseudonitzschiae]MBM1816613.1 signal peptidase I [Pseudosulfitobacter pseudonitzschiae]MBM1833211.1 signal peptidase I [Pseudosulfitobacter pseudonitzschiae]MBM1838079.1 signal peptidase I [Pseudosulfitobacter pseudonitzschiae]MBM1843340.1 signal peptidase I [Pseudosulfitobacter pseudonitzschiae]
MAAKEKSGNGFVETIKTIVYALLIAGVFRTLFFQPFWIPSGSMKETLLIGDFLFVNKMVYGYSYASCPSIVIPRIGLDVDAEDICGVFDGDNTRLFGGTPKHGDVVVFRHPVSGRDYIKRLIGVPGDTVQVKDGIVILNGEPLPQEPAGTFTESMERQGPQGLVPRCENGPVGEGGDCTKSAYIETMPNGVSYTVLNTANQSSDNTNVFQVPEGQYFFMGDNRDNSLDSRFSQLAGGVGFVPYENLIGRADRIMFSSAGRSMLFFWTWRGDRFFKGIH